MESVPIDFDNTEIAFAHKTKVALKQSNFVFSIMCIPWLVKLTTMLTTFALNTKLPVKGLIKRTLFNQFCGGESIRDCEATLKILGNYHVQTILDYSVEGLKSEDSFNDVKEEALRVIEYAKDNRNIPFNVIKLSGIGSTELMTKAQERKPLTEVDKSRLYYCEQRAIEIAQKTYDAELMLMIDAEESWIQNYIDSVTYRLMEKFNKERPVVYNSYQLYCHDALDRLKFGFIKASNEDFYLGAKLVRGAYMEKEQARAVEMNYISPLHKDKSSVDKDYDKALDFCIKNIGKIGVCAGTHNKQSCNHLVRLMEEAGLAKNDPGIYFAQLLGMGNNISFILGKAGYNVAKYVPYGPVEKVLPYLFRRAEENTSIKGQSGREHQMIKKELRRRKKAKEHKLKY